MPPEFFRGRNSTILAISRSWCDPISMPKRSSKRPRDANQLAKFIADVATGDAELPKTDEGKNPAAVALGRKGGLKGGKARAAKMSKKQLSAAARKAAQARWSRKD